MTNNGPQEKEQKDTQWSTRKRTKRKTMVHKKKNKKKNNGPQEKEQKDKRTIVFLFVLFIVDHCLSFCSFSCGPLFVFLFFFLWTNGPQEKEQKEKQWSTIKRAKRKTMVHKKKNKKTNNGPQEKEQKDKQWSLNL
jgi:hypothetical protein